jgi:hypothetical protein
MTDVMDIERPEDQLAQDAPVAVAAPKLAAEEKKLELPWVTQILEILGSLTVHSTDKLLFVAVCAPCDCAAGEVPPHSATRC